MATTNSIAQAEWLSQNVSEINVEESIGARTRDAWEARAMHAYYVDANLESALGLSELWMADEPYNVNAYLAAASVANVVDRYSLAKKITLAGLRLGHSDRLLNSLAFALISEGHYNEAEKVLLKVSSENQAMKLVATANWGMLAFRSNEAGAGRDLYQAAIDGFHALKLPESELLARLYFAKEASISGDVSLAASSLQQAIEMQKVHPRKHLVPQIERVEQLVRPRQS